jgi:hypothetical protein
MRCRSLVIANVALLLLNVVLIADRSPLTNRIVVAMVSVGLSEDVIVSLVLRHPGRYSLMPDDVARLGRAGVSQRIIAAMAFKAAIGANEPDGHPRTPARASRYLSA